MISSKRALIRYPNARRKRSTLEAEFALQLRAYKLAGWTEEFQFDPSRRWRIDFAWREQMLAVELEGGIWVNGGHNRGAIYEKNCEKYNALALSGWRLLRYTPGMVSSGRAIQEVAAALLQVTPAPAPVTVAKLQLRKARRRG